MGRYKTGTPGPGAYDPIKRQKGGKVRIGSAIRRPLYDTKNTPGPGNYEVRGKIEGPKYGIKPRRGDIGHMNRSKVPGPARYNPSLKYTNYKQPGFVIGTGTRDDRKPRLRTPGPGMYTPSNKIKGPKYR